MYTRDVHGNGKCGIPIPPVGFPWEWESNYLNKWEWDGNENSSDVNDRIGTLIFNMFPFSYIMFSPQPV